MARLSFSRRRVLQTLAMIPATLPFARALRADAEAPPTRLLLLMQNNGTQQGNFWPDASLGSPILDHLFLEPQTKQDNGLRAKTNLIKQVYVPNDANGTTANQHDMGFARMFTGEKLLSRGGQPWGGGISIDQLLAKQRMIGKAGGALPRGGRVIDAGPQVFNRLGCTILNLMSGPTAGFGDVPDCGVFAGLFD